MTMQEIRALALSQGIKPGKLNKRGLIRAIQTAEGNFACFGTARDGDCDQSECLWREDCFAAAKRGLTS